MFPSPPLPNYTLRYSQRAKYVNLRVSRQHGLEVVVPIGYDVAQIPAILRKRQAWIAKHLQRFAVEDDQSREVICPLPDRISLLAIAETWSVHYVATAMGRISLQEQLGNRLLLQGATSDRALCQRVLESWLKRKAYIHLAPWLLDLSRTHQLPFTHVSIRGQKTRWGSCSSRQSINLNYKLLFLPEALVRYVLIHELCHTVHLNHSPDFWALVAHLEPNYHVCKQELKKVDRLLPQWLS
ncbi:M48 family metallopeptidase [Trichothermofontia sp.]